MSPRDDPSADVLLIGGRGFLGSRVAPLFERHGLRVRVAGRDAGAAGVDVALDIARPETLAAMDDHRFVVNCADISDVSPIPAMRRCLERGNTFVETTADPRVIEAATEALADFDEPRGSVVLGVGVFPGLSNLLAKELAARWPDVRGMDIAVRTSPFAGAGGAMCRLMVELLRIDAVHYIDGERVLSPPASRGPRVPFTPGGSSPTVRLRFPEATTLHRALGMPDVGTSFGVSPGWSCAVVSRTTATGLLEWRLPRAAFHATLGLVRRVVLRSRPTPITIVAARGEHVARLRCADGVLLGAHAIAAQTAARRSAPARPGLVFAEEVDSLEAIVESIREHARGDLTLDVEFA